MYYLKNIKTGVLAEMSHMPIKPELFIEITEEEYNKLLESLEEEPVNG